LYLYRYIVNGSIRTYSVPKEENRIYLGYFSNCKEALEGARKHYSDIEGCYYCCSPCLRSRLM